jgi:triacylglycerol lipase
VHHLEEGEKAKPRSIDTETSPSRPPYPIVLVHGFSGFNSLGPLQYFYRVIKVLAEEGETEIFAPALPPFHSIEGRAAYLGRALDGVLDQTRADKVHIIAHSQGGLDARYAIAALGYGDRVASLITVATPHRGTPLADYVLRLPEGLLDPLARTLAWVLGVLDDQGELPPADSGQGTTRRTDLTASLASLSTANMSTFNERFPDPPEVPLYSIAGVSNLSRADEICRESQWGALERVDVMDPLLIGTAAVLAGANLLAPVPNDGIVPTASMRRGIFLGCIPADHFDQVGQLLDNGPQFVSGFDHLAFYRDLVTMIRRFEKTGFPLK